MNIIYIKNIMYIITKIKKNIDNIEDEIKEFYNILIQLSNEIDENKDISICKYIYDKEIKDKYVNMNLITLLIFLEKYGGFNNIKNTLNIYICKIKEEVEYNCFMILLLNSILKLDFEKIEKYSIFGNEYFDNFYVLKDYVKNNFRIRKYCTSKNKNKSKESDYKESNIYNENYLFNKEKRLLYNKNNENIIKDIKDNKKAKKRNVYNEIYNNNRKIIENISKIYNKYGNKLIDETEYKNITKNYDNNLNRFNKISKIYYEIYKNQKIYESKYIFPYYELEHIHINEISEFIKLLEYELCYEGE